MNNRKSKFNSLQKRIHNELTELDSNTDKLVLFAPNTYIDWVVQAKEAKSNIALVDFLASHIEFLAKNNPVVTYDEKESSYISDALKELEANLYLEATSEKDYPQPDTFPLDVIAIRDDADKKVGSSYEDFESIQNMKFKGGYVFFIFKLNFEKLNGTSIESALAVEVETKFFRLYANGKWVMKLNAGEQLISHLSTDDTKRPYKFVKHILEMKSIAEDSSEIAVEGIKKALNVDDKQLENVINNLNKYIKENKLTDFIKIGRNMQKIYFYNSIQDKTKF